MRETAQWAPPADHRTEGVFNGLRGRQRCTMLHWDGLQTKVLQWDDLVAVELPGRDVESMILIRGTDGKLCFAEGLTDEDFWRLLEQMKPGTVDLTVPEFTTLARPLSRALKQEGRPLNVYLRDNGGARAATCSCQPEPILMSIVVPAAVHPRVDFDGAFVVVFLNWRERSFMAAGIEDIDSHW